MVERASREESEEISEEASHASDDPLGLLRAEVDSEIEEEVIEVIREDLPYIIGKGEAALRKIAEVSGADIEIDGVEFQLVARGSARQRRDVKKFARFLGEQRRGAVRVSEADLQENGIIMRIPSDGIKNVLGRGGKFLRTVEDTWKVIMFLSSYSGSAIIGGSARDTRFELLAIFGNAHGRRGAQLDVMSAVESNVYGYYSDGSNYMGDAYDDHYRDHDLGTSMLSLSDSDVAFTIGKKGLTRRKLQRASESIMQFVGNTLFVSGTKAQRKRGKDYMKWLFAQLEGPVNVDPEGRDDVTTFDVPEDIADAVSGEGRRQFIRLEDEWGVIMFYAAGTEEDTDPTTRLLCIFGPERARVAVELELLNQLEFLKPGFLVRGVSEKKSNHEGFDTEVVPVRHSLVEHLLGPDKLAMKRIREASGAIFQRVADALWIAGDGRERKRCRDYLNWHLQAAKTRSVRVDARGRDDITEIDIPAQAQSYVMGNNECELRRLSSETGTFCIWAVDHNGEERLCVLGRDEGDEHSEKGRTKAEIMVTDMIEERLDMHILRKSGNAQKCHSKRYRIPSPPAPTRRGLAPAPPPAKRQR